MNKLTRCAHFLLLAVFAAVLFSQVVADETDSQEPKFPNSKSQKEEILKAEYKKNLEDAGRLAELAESLKADLEKNGRHVFSLASLKQIEEIETLARRIRGRMKRF